MPDLLSNISLSDFQHSTPIQVRFNDTDSMGHVTNMQYLGYCDIARIRYFHHVLKEKIDFSKESLVIASVKIDFIHQIFFEEAIDVRTKISVLGNKSLQMLQLICNTETNEVKSLVHTVMSGFNYVEQRSIVIPQHWKNAILAFDTKVEDKATNK